MNDGTGKTIEEKRVALETLRAQEEAERKRKHRRFVGKKRETATVANEKMSGRRFLS